MSVDIIRARLQNQLLLGRQLDTPEQVVSWFGAVQSQDYSGAKWALGLRTSATTDALAEQAFNAGRILRTHVLRPTWHFVAPADIRWMLALTAPRVRVALAYNDRRLGLESSILKKSRNVLANALRGNRQRTRSELAPVLQKAGLPVDGLSLGQLLIHAELDGLICSGPRKGKQFTYALLEERAAQATGLEKEEALAELTKRYFRSHGPATAQDFAWWSGLTMSEARNGIESVKSEFGREVLDEKTYWFSASSLPPETVERAWLLPNYDEYTVGYKNRSAILDAAHAGKLDAREGLLAQSLLSEGRIVGMWKRTLHKDRVVVQLSLFTALGKTRAQQVTEAAERYGEFLELAVELVM